MNCENRLKELRIKLPEAPKKGGLYTPAKVFCEKLVYVSGCGPSIEGKAITGKMGKDFDVEQGKQYARQCMLNVLATLKDAIGTLDRVKTCAKITVFVASDDEFLMQPQVGNGASELIQQVFGENHLPSRSAVGVNVLPGNIPVEVEALFEIEA